MRGFALPALLAPEAAVVWLCCCCCRCLLLLQYRCTHNYKDSLWLGSRLGGLALLVRPLLWWSLLRSCQAAC